ncbi:MAG: hypothetical protein WDM96_11050 [Lacunisphaera sp.]
MDRSAGISCAQPAGRGSPDPTPTRDHPHHERSVQTPPAPPSPQDAASRHEEELTQPPKQQHTERLTAEQLKSESKERAADRPILQKILGMFRKEKGSFRELVINSEPLEKRVALLVDGTLDRFEIERESDNRMVGGIYKGRIKNLDPGLKAAFVDIGFNKNAFLHYWDMLPAATDSSVEVVRVNKKKGRRAARCRADRQGTSPASTRPAARSSSRSPRARSAPRARARRPTSRSPAVI